MEPSPKHSEPPLTLNATTEEVLSEWLQQQTQPLRERIMNYYSYLYEVTGRASCAPEMLEPKPIAPEFLRIVQTGQIPDLRELNWGKPQKGERPARSRAISVSPHLIASLQHGTGIPQPDAWGQSADVFEQVDAALGELTAKQNMTAVLRYLYGWKYQEIAKAKGVAIGTVRGEIHVVRRKLRSVLRDLNKDVQQAGSLGGLDCDGLDRLFREYGQGGDNDNTEA
jgi:RNA polymerase sigma factor (sigma-70 family)